METNKVDYTTFALSREDILWEIRQRCMKEMYAKAQPSEDYDKIYAYYNECKEKGVEPERIYERHYLSQEEFEYIVEKYVSLYGLKNEFKEHCDIIIRDITEGCHKNKYIDSYTDENGFYHHGYRSFEEVQPLKETIGEETTKTILDFIEDRKDYYRFDQDENKFRFSIALTDSPTCNPKTVIEYWKTQNKEIEIDPRKHNHDYFWKEENGYLDNEDSE